MIICCINVDAQTVKDVIQLDTIIQTNQTDFGIYSPTMSAYGSSLWIYFPSPNDNDDSLFFLHLNINTNKLDTIWGVIPSLFFKVFQPKAYAMSVNDKFLAVKFLRSIAIFDVVSNRTLKFKTITPLFEDAKYIKLLNNDKILFGRCYNYHSLDYMENTMIAIYDIKTETLEETKYPEFSSIEFSHFSPNHWIDASNKKILFSQTTEYKIDIFNSALIKSETIERKVPDWNNFDSTIAVRFRKTINESNRKTLIDSLFPYENIVSRLEGAYFIDDSTVFVRYIPANNKKQNRLRLIDIWRLNVKNNWQLLFTDLRDEKPGNETLITRNNYPLLSTYYDICFSEGKLIVLKSSANINEFGKTYATIEKEKDSYFIKNNPGFFIYIYSLKLNKN